MTKKTKNGFNKVKKLHHTIKFEWRFKICPSHYTTKPTLLSVAKCRPM